MFKHRLVSASLFLIVLAGSAAWAQSVCPAGVQSDKLICVIPQVYGANGLVLQNVSAQALGVAPFQNGLPAALSPLNASVARQTALLPLASPSSGITFSWNEAAKVFVESTDSLGPVFSERAETIGKSRVYVGFGYEYFSFESHDGTRLNNLNAVFTQPDTFAANINGGTTCSLKPADSVANLGQCGFIRDVITTKNSLNLKLHQYTTFATFGVTSRIDVSMAIPIESIRMELVSDATIRNISKTGVHQFPDRPGCSPCLTSTSSNSGAAAGIGDITFRVKGMAWKGEKGALALGVDVRVPTGDALNFLGAGAAGFKPFLVWSRHSRISPHAFVGYESNGSSVVAGDITTGGKQRLPGELTYSSGVDLALTKRLSAAFDVIGEQVFQAKRLSVKGFTEPLACTNPNCTNLVSPPAPSDPDITATTGTYNLSSASLGVKTKPFSRLVITGNVMVALNKGGLRAKVVPFIGAAYTF
jgi:hypothetical protein